MRSPYSVAWSADLVNCALTIVGSAGTAAIQWSWCAVSAVRWFSAFSRKMRPQRNSSAASVNQDNMKGVLPIL